MSQQQLLSERSKKLILLAVVSVLTCALLSFGPIAQDTRYHLFADVDVFAGVSNFWNVASNLPFVAVGIFAFWRMPRLLEQNCLTAYWVLSVSIALTGFGSAYYHYAPTNATLLWDRLPMTLVFMGVFSILLEERVIRSHKQWVLWTFLSCGIAAAFYWAWTETQGRGDLRPYILVQFLPVILTPIIMLLFQKKYLSNRWLFGAFFWYVLAKILETYDHPIQSALLFVGGHPLKHIAAAIAALCLVCAIPVSAQKKSLKLVGNNEKDHKPLHTK